MAGRVALAMVLVLVQAGLVRGTGAPYSVPNIAFAYLIAESTRLEPHAAGWLGLGVGLAQAVFLSAPLGVEPLMMTVIGVLVSLLYRNPLQSGLLVPLIFSSGCVMVYQLFLGVAAWVRWGYPLAPSQALIVQKGLGLFLTSILATAMLALLWRGQRVQKG